MSKAALLRLCSFILLQDFSLLRNVSFHNHPAQKNHVGALRHQGTKDEYTPTEIIYYFVFSRPARQILFIMIILKKTTSVM
jgi:hypothetical protein